MKRYLFILLVCLLASPVVAEAPFGPQAPQFIAQQDPDFLPVAQAYQSLLRWEGDTLLVQWTIADGYYLYKERFRISASLDGKDLAIDTEFEPGKIKDDPYFGRTEVFYYNTALSIKGLPRGEPFSLSVISQGCADAGLCYPPQQQQYRHVPDSGALELIDSDTPLAGIPAASAGETDPLWLIVIFAALGGAILNLMPCVFPVLSLKVLSFASAGEGRAAHHGWVYSLGVVVSFLAVAAVLIALQQAGQAVGWGFQLQSPGFVAALATLFFLLSLNLLGIFNIAGSWMNLGGQLSQRSGYSGSFFTGVLATLVASPCTAPFMGTAVGYAASQPAVEALLVFGSLGAGMALPVLLLSLHPAWLKKLPKPGPWMENLRQFLAFPLLASAIWLLWVVGRQLGATTMAALLIAWLLVGFAIWLWRRGRFGKLCAVVALASAIAATAAGFRAGPDRESAASFDPSRIDTLRRQGQNVFLDVTADWCITCAANERLVLNTDRIQQAFKDHNVAYLVADWTRYDPAITTLLAQYGRNGIPLYVYFPADLTQPPRILPQILSKDMVMAVLNPQLK